MEDLDFYIAYPDCLDINVEIRWTVPFTHDVLSSGLVAENETAYYYVIVAKKDGEWVPFYIGMVYTQDVAKRHTQLDHVLKLTKLKKKYKNLTFSLSLGTPTFLTGKNNAASIKKIEELLIYSNWRKEMENVIAVNTFKADKQIYVKNTGFIEHLYGESAHGVMRR